MSALRITLTIECFECGAKSSVSKFLPSDGTVRFPQMVLPVLHIAGSRQICPNEHRTLKETVLTEVE